MDLLSVFVYCLLFGGQQGCTSVKGRLKSPYFLRNCGGALYFGVVM